MLNRQDPLIRQLAAAEPVLWRNPNTAPPPRRSLMSA